MLDGSVFSMMCHYWKQFLHALLWRRPPFCQIHGHKKANFRKLRTVHLQGKGRIIFFCDFKTFVVGLAIGIVQPPALLPSLQQFRLLPTFSLFFQFSLAQLYHNGIGMTKDLKVALDLYEVYSKKISNLLKFTWVSSWVPRNELSAL